MTRKKNKLIAFFCSLIPGAGEMYLGFMKQGISLMTVFWAIVILSGFFRMTVLMFLTPIVWFYSFFNTNNLNNLPDEEFYALDDDYLIHVQYLFENSGLLKKYHKLIALVLILFGCSILWNNVSVFLFSYLFPSIYISDAVMDILYYIGGTIPQTVVGIGIIIAGWYLIKNKSEDLNRKDYLPSPPYSDKGDKDN